MNYLMPLNADNSDSRSDIVRPRTPDASFYPFSHICPAAKSIVHIHGMINFLVSLMMQHIEFAYANGNFQK